jgi:hypothetical protein
MKTMTQAELVAELRQRFGDDARQWTFICPICKTRQNANDFFATGQFKPGTGEVNKYLGFSCIGRFTGAGPHKPGRAPGRGCDWTLGGLLQVHELEIILPNGKRSPAMEMAAPLAQAKEAA